MPGRKPPNEQVDESSPHFQPSPIDSEKRPYVTRKTQHERKGSPRSSGGFVLPVDRARRFLGVFTSIRIIPFVEICLLMAMVYRRHAPSSRFPWSRSHFVARKGWRTGPAGTRPRYPRGTRYLRARLFFQYGGIVPEASSSLPKAIRGFKPRTVNRCRREYQNTASSRHGGERKGCPALMPENLRPKLVPRECFDSLPGNLSSSDPNHRQT